MAFNMGNPFTVDRTIQPRSSVEFTYQSQSINFSEWISLLTLCLAPLVAHIIAGVPEPVILQNPPPDWQARMCHYNPTSILWRYLVIFDRRARAKTWTALDMAASNAEFWTGFHWDGSESMITKTRTKCIRFSKSNRVQLLSTSAAKTVVIAFQGAQACYALLAGLKGGLFGLTSGVHTIFFPLAILGLLRLPAALWLSDALGYTCGDWPNDPATDLMSTDQDRSISSAARTSDSLESQQSAPIMPVASSETGTQGHTGPSQNLNPLQLSEYESSSSHDLFYPISGRQGVATRIIFLVPMLGLWVLDLLYFRPSTDLIWTATNLSVNIYYFFLLTVTLVVIATYVVKGKSTTTIIPCINSIWYKAYTCILFVLALLMLIISALETHKTPCGQFTTYATTLIAEKGWMQLICPDIPGNTTTVLMSLGTERNAT